ncbi:hypothetical protein ACIBKY_41625 [Nonomuraea sp. NPDC050394]|uniref:hypothetical protein n=1 Tax=Nonomuraea sp. NPDC050394 TaxID=3364363 RepID=UPI0037A9E183
MPTVTFRDETTTGKALEIITAPELVRPRVRRTGWERQADIAERAFGRDGFLLMAGDRQIEDLAETIGPRVEHIALVGG